MNSLINHWYWARRSIYDGGVLHHGRRKVREHRATGKPVANVTRYPYTDGDDDTYLITFTRHRDLAVSKLIEGLGGIKRVAAKLVRFDGAYLRFTGELRIEYQHAGKIVDSYTDTAIWELMYLGKTHTQQ